MLMVGYRVKRDGNRAYPCIHHRHDSYQSIRK
jgi:hypothetical protein